MAAEYISKHGTISRSPFEMYMAFVDMRNFMQMIPDDKKDMVVADFDTIQATVQGFTIGVKVKNRIPYSRIEFEDNAAPFHFELTLFFDPIPTSNNTDFHIEVSADLNLMMQKMLGNKIQEGIDKIVDAMENPSKYADKIKF